MEPPSATVGVAESDTVVVSIVSLTAVVAGVGSMLSAMPPPDVPVMVALMLVGST